MNNKRIIPILVGLGMGLLSLLNKANVMANNYSSSLTVSPPNQEIILLPGETYEGSITVSNSNEAENNLDYSVSIESFSQKQADGSADDYGTVDTETISSYNQMIEWISLGKKNGTIKPNESDTIPFTIVVPENAPAGGQYASIAIQDDTKRGDENGNVTIESKTRILSIIYAEIAGKTKELGSVTENSIPSILLSNSLEATSVVKNDGNIHTNASYILQVWPLFSNEEICTNEEEPNKSLIIPETEKLHVEQCNLPSVGIFRVKQTVKIFDEESIIEKTIIYCPLWLMFIIIFAIIALIIWLIMKARSHKSKS